VTSLRALGTALVCTIAGSAIVGCSYATNVASGGACQRTVQCAPGLVCSQGHCTNDLSMFGMGHPTNLDGGLVDGAAVDMGVTMYDANLPDTGVPPVDAFTPPVDMGVAPNDAFTPPVDAFTPPVDAFTPPPVDANLPDAWVDPNDAA
jgi:hypothetical protein